MAHDRGVSVDDDLGYERAYEHLTLVRPLLARHRDEQHAAAQRSEPESSG